MIYSQYKTVVVISVRRITLVSLAAQSVKLELHCSVLYGTVNV